MKKQPFVLVISDVADSQVVADPQLKMLAAVPHAVVNSKAALDAAPKDAEAILHWAGPRDLLRAAFLANPGVRWVHSRAAGLDSMLFPELVESDVPLTNGKGVFSQSLGEFALGVILYFAKDFRRMLRNQEAGRWDQFDVEEIAGQTVGIVGYGDIGHAVARRVHAMGMRVLALKRHAPKEPNPLEQNPSNSAHLEIVQDGFFLRKKPLSGSGSEYIYSDSAVVARFYAPEEMATMLGECDFVVAAAPLTPETQHMISDAAFAAMKPNAVVINVGRGPVIDQAALVRALEAKRIKGAGLDVFEKEPIPEGDPIYRFDNVLVSPHCADHTKNWLNDAMRFFLAQYERFAKGEPLENLVEKRLGY